MTATTTKATALSRNRKPDDQGWTGGLKAVVIGKDILELLSSSMYIDPITIFREYVQNAVDAIDQHYSERSSTKGEAPEIKIDLDPTARTVRIRDNGAGIPGSEFAARLTAIGASKKRGTAARGFRGIGRLAGLGYCQELIFRSRTPGESEVSELRWDCRRLKTALRSGEFSGDLSDLISSIVSFRKVRGEAYPKRFFEVELSAVVRHRNDKLLSSHSVAEYLRQVAPLPFAPDFQFGNEIAAALASHMTRRQIDVRVSGIDAPLFRPHKDELDLGNGTTDKFRDIEIREIPGVDGGVAAVAWILHHGYHGALPNHLLIKGIRLRSGDIQIGDHTILESEFPESRFNAWSVGEVHILDKRIIPNGRRDHFEESVHLSNLVNHLGPHLKEIAQRCRTSSLERKWLRDFEFNKSAALENASAAHSPTLTKNVRNCMIQAARKSLNQMSRISKNRHLTDDVRDKLIAETDNVSAKVAALVDNAPALFDPLSHYPAKTRAAYRQIIELIYECSSTSGAAKALVERILARLTGEQIQGPFPQSASDG